MFERQPPSVPRPINGATNGPANGPAKASSWAGSILHPLPLRVLVDRAMVETRRHFRRLYLPFAFVLALAYGALSLVLGLWTEGIETGAYESTGGGIALIVGGCLAFVFIALASMLTLIALQVATIDVVSGKPLDLRRAWFFAFQPRAMGTLLLFLACLMVGTMLCVFPVIWVMIVLSFLFPVMVIEDRFGTAALRRSYQLARYNPQGSLIDNPQVKIVLVLLVTWGLSLLVGMLLKMPFQILQALLLVRDAAVQGEALTQLGQGYVWLSVLSEVFGALGSTAVQIYSFTAITLLYFDCRRRKEGGDLEEALDRLGAPRPNERSLSAQVPRGEALDPSLGDS